MSGLGLAIYQAIAYSNRHSRVSGNPENPDGSMMVFGRTVLDSRLRGNDGCVSRPLSYVIPSVAEESKSLEMESRPAFQIPRLRSE